MKGEKMINSRKFAIAVLIVFAVLILAFDSLYATEKPNILVIWGDDIGQTNISAYSRGMMGYKTPNIDRIVDEGMSSPIIMASRAVPQAVHRLLQAKVFFAQVSVR
jgi:hypothetical protein